MSDNGWRKEDELAPKYIFVTGGVVSSLGKGLAAASMGALLEARGFRVTLQKMDPYINVDAGTMSPYQHGEVFVTDDGGETDLDLGHYERFTSGRVTRDHNVTTGKVYYSVIQKERRGDYLGRTVQVIPHITDEIKASIRKVGRDTDIVIVEVGGTVGDIEGLPFLEAIRQLKKDVGRDNVIYVHLTLVPFMRAAAELKTKATQHSVKELRAIGIQPDILLCRTDRYLPPGIKSKIALFCDVEEEAVITAKDVDTIYEVPLVFHREGLDDIIVKLLNLESRPIDLSRWEGVVSRVQSPRLETRIAVVGKYIELKDSYKSLVEALAHGGIANDARVEVQWIDAEHIERDGAAAQFSGIHGILVPGGFGDRGILGKIEAVRYAREQRVPYFGICLGMQCAVIEYARNVCGLTGANSSEFDPAAPHRVIDLLPDQRSIADKGGTMRLGNYPIVLGEGSLASRLYGQGIIQERHRHRYEVNNDYLPRLEKNGLRVSGIWAEKQLVEIIEIPEHPYFVAGQFHPEFRSRPWDPHPLFSGFVRAALEHGT
ncbi:MAG: CTP synthetase [Candidatus Rokuibacteriota bacterium]|nr:MAG: CTP synthetase [Candidatus Rokubacteria bacterium]